jgi:hypothetical protein
VLAVLNAACGVTFWISWWIKSIDFTMRKGKGHLGLPEGILFWNQCILLHPWFIVQGIRLDLLSFQASCRRGCGYGDGSSAHECFGIIWE